MRKRARDTSAALGHSAAGRTRQVFCQTPALYGLWRGVAPENRPVTCAPLCQPSTADRKLAAEAGRLSRRADIANRSLRKTTAWKMLAEPQACTVEAIHVDAGHLRERGDRLRSTLLVVSSRR